MLSRVKMAMVDTIGLKVDSWFRLLVQEWLVTRRGSTFITTCNWFSYDDSTITRFTSDKTLEKIHQRISEISQKQNVNMVIFAYLVMLWPWPLTFWPHNLISSPPTQDALTTTSKVPSSLRSPAQLQWRPLANTYASISLGISLPPHSYCTYMPCTYKHCTYGHQPRWLLTMAPSAECLWVSISYQL